MNKTIRSKPNENRPNTFCTFTRIYLHNGKTESCGSISLKTKKEADAGSLWARSTPILPLPFLFPQPCPELCSQGSAMAPCPSLANKLITASFGFQTEFPCSSDVSRGPSPNPNWLYTGGLAHIWKQCCLHCIILGFKQLSRPSYTTSE